MSDIVSHMNLTDTDARTELNTLFSELSADPAHYKTDLSVFISETRLQTDENKWDHVELRVCFTYTHDNGHGRIDNRSESFLWRMGLGMIDWAVPFKRAFAYGIHYSERERYGHRTRSIPSHVMGAIIQSSPAILNLFKKACSPAEVLARFCADAQSANQPFAMWADDFGMDSDSIKARDMYDACQNEGIKARRLVDGKTFDRLAELANAL